MPPKSPKSANRVSPDVGVTIQEGVELTAQEMKQNVDTKEGDSDNSDNEWNNRVTTPSRTPPVELQQKTANRKLSFQATLTSELDTTTYLKKASYRHLHANGKKRYEFRVYYEG